MIARRTASLVLQCTALLAALYVFSSASASAQAPADRCLFIDIAGGTHGFAGGNPQADYFRINPGTTATVRYECTDAGDNLALTLPNGSSPAVSLVSHAGKNWEFSITVDAAPSTTYLGPLRLTATWGGNSASKDISVLVGPEGWVPPAEVRCENTTSTTPTGTRTWYALPPVEVKVPGSTQFVSVPTNEMCATASKEFYQTPTGLKPHAFVDLRFSGGGPDLNKYPIESVYRVSGAIPDYTPTAAGGGIRDPRLTTSDGRFTLEAKAVEWIQPSGGQSGPSSVTCTNTKGVRWGAVLPSASLSGVPPEWDGMTWSSNGHTLAPPVVIGQGTPSPGLFFDVTGCGDGDPATKDGYLQAFLPIAFVKLMGVDGERLASVSDSELKSLFSVTNNGASVDDITFTKASDSSGIKFNYELSFSQHKITIAANPKTASEPAPSTVLPTKPSVRWKASKKKRTVMATVKLTAGSTVTHAISAKKLRAKKPKSGKCKVDKKKTKATCTVKLSKGRWTVSVTPKQGALAGTANSKTFKF